MVHEAEPLEPSKSKLTDILINALINTTGWKPYEKDGGYLSAYRQVFVLFRKDGSIDADYLR